MDNPFGSNGESHSSELKSTNNTEESSHAISISKYTKALIKTWTHPPQSKSSSVIKIAVSQTVSFMAFVYEKLRNAVEFREDHLIKRAAIERILKRRMILNENGRDIAEPLIKELLWARYYENNTIGEEKISEIQTSIDKYFFLRNELIAGRGMKEQDEISQFILEVLSCEIEEILSPPYKSEAFTNYVYQILRPYILTFSDDETERDIQVYIAVEKAFAHSDSPLLRYHLLKLILPEITSISWKSADKVLPKLYDAYRRIENDLNHPLKDNIRNAIKKQIPPFLILRDIFEQNHDKIGNVLTDENKLKYKVDDACRKRYQESHARLRRTAVRSFIYIVLTKVVFAFILEIPYDLYVQKTISYIPIGINVIFPPILMALIILTVTIPGDDNTRKIYQLIKGIIDNDPDTLPVTKGISIKTRLKTRGFVFTTLFSIVYLLMYFVSFGSIIYGLSILKFNVISQTIFIFFVTLVTFFAYRVIQITQQYQVVTNEGLLSTLTDFFFLPIIRVGQWLSGEVLQRFNVFIFLFDFIVEMPFKAIVEVFDEWVHFVRLKKEEIM